jgi:hypothetical protein
MWEIADEKSVSFLDEEICDWVWMDRDEVRSEYFLTVCQDGVCPCNFGVRLPRQKTIIFTHLSSSSFRPCVIDSMFQVPWPPEVGARALPTEHKVDFQHSTLLLLMYCRCLFKVCVDNFQNFERSMSYIVHVCIFHCVCLQDGRPKWVRAGPET